MPRKKTTKVRTGLTGTPDATGKELVIVESPAKARTVNKYLGDEYLVMASVGHVRDLPDKNPKGIKGFSIRLLIVWAMIPLSSTGEAALLPMG